MSKWVAIKEKFVGANRVQLQQLGKTELFSVVRIEPGYYGSDREVSLAQFTLRDTATYIYNQEGKDDAKE